MHRSPLRKSVPSLPSLAKNSSPQHSPSNMSRRSSLPLLHPASSVASCASSFEESFDSTSRRVSRSSASPPRKFRKSSTLSSLAHAGSALAGAPGNALRRAVKRLGGKSQKTDQMTAVEEEMIRQLKEEAQETKANKKRLQELYCKPSQLSIHQMPVGPHQSLGDTDVGMVRLTYSKIRSLREAKDYDNVYKRNSWKDLVGDLRHGIRVCMKAQGFLNILMESYRKEPEQVSPSWCVNASLEKQKMWMELLSFVGKPTVKSQAIDLSRLDLDKEFADYKAMIASSVPSAQLKDDKAMIASSVPSTQSEDEEQMSSVPSGQTESSQSGISLSGASIVSSIRPKAPASPPPERRSPTLARLTNRSGKSKA